MVSRTSTTLLRDLHDPQNDRAWRRFYRRYTPMLLSYAKRVGLTDADAQDVVAETLTTFVEAYRAGRYDRNRARLKSWLGGIAQKKIYKFHARRKPVSLDVPVGEDSARSLDPQAPYEPDEAFEREWQLERLNEALDRLRTESDPDTYQAFDLYALKSWPVAKVATFLNVTRNAVYISKTRCVQKLQRIVRQIDQEGD